MAEESSCMSPSCGITIEGTFKRCPQCGALMRSPGSIRAFGWVMLVCGVFAVGLLAHMSWVFLSAGSFTGTTSQALLFVAFFAFLFLLSLTGFSLGLYMVVTGRRNRWLVKAMLLGVSIFVIGAIIARIIIAALGLLA